MNPQERQLLERLLDRLGQIRGIRKDPEADAMISKAVRRQPDAPYLLVQRSLLLERALDQAQSRIVELERDQATDEGSFLDPGSGGVASPARAATGAGSPMRWMPPGQPTVGPAAAPASTQGGPGSGFLGQAAATAAGVAGGALLFEGMESLLGHHGNSWPSPSAAGVSAPEDVTINNYYEGDDATAAQGNEPLGDDDLDSAADDSFV